MTDPLHIEALGHSLTWRECAACSQIAPMEGIFCDKCVERLTKIGISSELTSKWRPTAASLAAVRKMLKDARIKP